jgi:hypothetical protein
VKKALIFVMLLAACEVEEQPRRWPVHLDSYMLVFGYTLNEDRDTILKNGYPVWADRNCFRCIGNFSLVPGELVTAIREDFFAARDAAQEQYIADLSSTIGVEPIQRVVETE